MAVCIEDILPNNPTIIHTDQTGIKCVWRFQEDDG